MLRGMVCLILRAGRLGLLQLEAGMWVEEHVVLGRRRLREAKDFGEGLRGKATASGESLLSPFVLLQTQRRTPTLLALKRGGPRRGSRGREGRRRR